MEKGAVYHEEEQVHGGAGCFRSQASGGGDTGTGGLSQDGDSRADVYRWKKKYAGMGVAEVKEAESLLLGITLTDDDLVFSTPEGKPLRPNTVTRAWTNLAKRCGLKVIRLHDARHSHASLLLKQGIHPKVVQERLGHSTIAVTLDTYSHVSPGIQEAAAKRFDEAFTTRYNEAVEKVIG